MGSDQERTLHPNMRRTVRQCFPDLNHQNGDVGIELEIEGLNLPTSVQGWSIHQENSLRGKNGRVIREGGDGGNDVPREYITNGAYTITSLAPYLRDLHKALTDKGVEVNLTTRASTHIHVNVQNCTLRDYFGFLFYFVILEPVLLRLCGPQRNGNLFCVPTAEAADMPSWVRRCVKTIESGSFLYWPSENNGQHRGKYGAINTDPLMTYGSVEIRCFPNTIDPDTIYKWCTWLTRIRRLSQAWRTAQYADLFDAATLEPVAFAQAIFTDENLGAVCSPQTVSDLIAVGVESSYEVYRALHPMLYYDSSKKKKEKAKIPEPDEVDDEERDEITQLFDEGSGTPPRAWDEWAEPTPRSVRGLRPSLFRNNGLRSAR